MKKTIALCLALLMIFSLFTFVACGKKKKADPADELTEAQKYAALIDVKIPEKISLDDGVIKFSVTNSSDRDCYIIGPLGRDMIKYCFSRMPDLYTYMVLGDHYYEDNDKPECKEFNERFYLTVPAGETVEYTLKNEWYFKLEPNSYQLTISITDDVTDGVFETMIEKNFDIE